MNTPGYKVLEELECLTTRNGSRKMVTVTAWMGRPGKLDIRWWMEDGRPGKGVTLNAREAAQLAEILSKYAADHGENPDHDEQEDLTPEQRKQLLAEMRAQKRKDSVAEAFTRTAGRSRYVRATRMARYLGVTPKTIRNRVAETDDYIYRDGYVHKLA